MDIFHKITLNDGHQIPVIGMGTDRILDQEIMDSVVEEGFALGYRHIDTADWYQNESLVGSAITNCGLPREEIFITTKLNNPHQGYLTAKEACKRSLDRLKTDYIDLYLIHWPGLDTKNTKNRLDSYRALLEMQQEGLIRSIGVCNFQKRHIEELVRVFGVAPAVNQIERHPWQIQREMIQVNHEYGVHTEAWAPLMRGRLPEVQGLAQIAQKYGKSLEQIVLRWNLQSGVGFIPKTSKPARLRENADIFDFSLTKDEMRLINEQDQDFRLRYHPDTMDVGFPEPSSSAEQ